MFQDPLGTVTRQIAFSSKRHIVLILFPIRLGGIVPIVRYLQSFEPDPVVALSRVTLHAVSVRCTDKSPDDVTLRQYVQGLCCTAGTYETALDALR